MARIGVFSDTHGSVENLFSLLPRLGTLDSVFHLGDVTGDAKRIADRLNTGFVSVRGNCDGWAREPLEQIVTWHGHRILLLHGHLYAGRLALLYHAKEQNCSVVCFGHSHVASIETHDGVLLLNPGSLSRPRSGQGPSCAILQVTEKDITAELLFVESK